LLLFRVSILSYRHTFIAYFKYCKIYHQSGMGTIKKVSQLILFTAIIALVFGTGSLTTESLAQEEKNNQGKGEKPDKPSGHRNDDFL